MDIIVSLVLNIVSVLITIFILLAHAGNTIPDAGIAKYVTHGVFVVWVFQIRHIRLLVTPLYILLKPVDHQSLPSNIYDHSVSEVRPVPFDDTKFASVAIVAISVLFMLLETLWSSVDHKSFQSQNISLLYILFILLSRIMVQLLLR